MDSFDKIRLDSHTFLDYQALFKRHPSNTFPKSFSAIAPLDHHSKESQSVYKTAVAAHTPRGKQIEKKPHTLSRRLPLLTTNYTAVASSDPHRARIPRQKAKAPVGTKRDRVSRYKEARARARGREKNSAPNSLAEASIHIEADAYMCAQTHGEV